MQRGKVELEMLCWPISAYKVHTVVNGRVVGASIGRVTGKSKKKRKRKPGVEGERSFLLPIPSLAG